MVSQSETVGGDVTTDGEGRVLVWGEFVPAITDSAAWGLPALKAGGVVFDTADTPASPFAAADTVAISTLFLVAAPAPEAGWLSTPGRGTCVYIDMKLSLRNKRKLSNVCGTQIFRKHSKENRI